MSRNGSGTYSLPAGNPVVTGTTISSTWANSTLNDIASALTGSLAADGQTTASGNLNMGNNKITNLTDGTNAQDAVTYSQLAAATGALAGRIVQVLTQNGTQASTSSGSWTATGHSISITPTSASSKILVLLTTMFWQTNGYGGNAYLTMYRNLTNLSGSTAPMCMTAVPTNSNSSYQTTALSILDSPATTSAITYQPYIFADTGGTATYSGYSSARLTVLEIL